MSDWSRYLYNDLIYKMSIYNNILTQIDFNESKKDWCFDKIQMEEVFIMAELKISYDEHFALIIGINEYKNLKN